MDFDRVSKGRDDQLGWVFVLAIWAAYGLWFALKLPPEAIVTGDTNAYLTLAPYRPPVYGWVLNGFRWATGGLTHLPFLQLVLVMSGLLVFAIQLGLLLGSVVSAVASIILIAFHTSIHESPYWMMSESVFEFLVMVGLGLQFRSIRCRSFGSLAGAAVCFALAAATRTSGLTFLLIPLLSTWFDRNRRLATAAVSALQVALVMGAVLVVVMAANWERNGRFEIGSWTGISLLGKGLLLIEPSDVPDLPPPAASVAPAAASLRSLIEQQPDLAARLRAQDQAYQDLRFPLFYPEAEKTWPAWADADWETRGKLALAFSQKVIANHPLSFVGLWAKDWLSLVLYPNYWPNWATAQADGALFPACRLHKNCWVLARETAPVRITLDMLTVSLFGTVGGALLLIFRSWRVVRRRADPSTVLFWTIALVLHLSLIGTSAFEAGLARYTDITHILGVALLLWFASMVPAGKLAGRLAGFGTRSRAVLRSDTFLLSVLYAGGILLGAIIFYVCISAGALSLIGILFYRGLALVILAMVSQAAVLCFAVSGARRLRVGPPLGFIHLLPVVLTSTALNLAFFVLLPVNIDRSMSVFLLSWMSDHHDTPQTKEDLTKAIQQVYMDGFGAAGSPGDVPGSVEIAAYPSSWPAATSARPAMAMF